MENKKSTGRWSIGEVLKINNRYSIDKQGNLYAIRNKSGLLDKPKRIDGFLCGGYKKVILTFDGNKRIKTALHRLIASQFLGLDFNNKKMVVNHLDLNKLNNNLENLEVTTIEENIKHAARNGVYMNKKNRNKPNFYISKNAEVFKEITGIDINEPKSCDGKIVEIDDEKYRLSEVGE